MAQQSLELHGTGSYQASSDGEGAMNGSDGLTLHATNDASQFRSQISRRKRAFVLMGCSILQLPIWGFAMTYGVFQEYYHDDWSFKGSRSIIGVIGTTSNGVMYLSMPLLFAAFDRRWARVRRTAAFCGVLLACIGFLLSSFSTDIWHLLATQGILSAFGCVLVYSPTTLVLSEYFSTNNRALAYGTVLSCKNITGSVCPFLMQQLLQHVGFRDTMRIWTAIVAASGLIAVYLMPIAPPEMAASRSHRSRKIPWHFLHHRTVYIYSIAIVFQSSGYGIAQSYLNSYAHSVASLSAVSSTLLLTLFNAPGVIACAFFGLLTDNKRMPISAAYTTLISALASALAALLIWGLANPSADSMPLLILFSLVYGFFAGGYSSTWGGIIKEMERDAAHENEAIDTGMVYGVLNGARGIGYVVGGIAGVQLLKAGDGNAVGRFAYATTYGPLILYTGLSTLLGGWSVLLEWRELTHWIRVRMLAVASRRRPSLVLTRRPT